MGIRYAYDKNIRQGLLKTCYQNFILDFLIFLTITKSRLSSSSSLNAHWSISSAKLSYTLLIGREQSLIKILGGDFGNTFSKFRKV